MLGLLAIQHTWQSQVQGPALIDEQSPDQNKVSVWTESSLYSPVSFWDSQFSARPGQQSASMTGGSPVRSQLYYVKYHMPGEGSTVQGRRRLPVSPSSLQMQ